jgi:beta-lactamase superfamily II metal-dependent hydrolase
MTGTIEPLNNGVWETYALDVGQADAGLIITDTGKLILTDGDKDEVSDSLDEVLEGRDVERTEDGKIPIQASLTTHIHKDHVWGYESLYDDGYEIQHATQPASNRFEIVDSDTDRVKGKVGQNVREKFINGIAKHDIDTLSEVSTGSPLPPPLRTNGTVLAPPPTEDSVDVTRAATGTEVNLPPEKANENSAVYKIESERSVLFMGDVQDKSDHYGESWLIQQHDDPDSDVNLDADVLFVAHHGSANATSRELLKRVDPDMAVISSDFAKQHNHPSDEVLENLHDQDVGVYWTAGHGTIRTDLDEALTTDQAKDLETTAAADLAALKHYCKATDTSAEEVGLLAADDLPEGTPGWVAETAPMVAETNQEMVNAAIANADTVADVCQTLDDNPDATEHLHDAVTTDRAEHVTTTADVETNRQTYRHAAQAQRAATPSRTQRLQQTLPLIPDPDLPEYDGPAPKEIEGPFTEDAVPSAVKHTETAKTIRDDVFAREDPPDSLVAAENQANTAVETAETTEDLCRGLRETPGAHKYVRNETKTPPRFLREDNHTTERSVDLSHSEERGRGLSR